MYRSEASNYNELYPQVPVPHVQYLPLRLHLHDRLRHGGALLGSLQTYGMSRHVTSRHVM